MREVPPALLKRARTLRQRRLALGLLAKTVAYSIGQHPHAFCRWEKAQVMPRPENLKRWRAFLAEQERKREVS